DAAAATPDPAPAAPLAPASAAPAAAADDPAPEVTSVEVALCAERLVLLRYGSYDFYEHISRTFFRSEHA
ncbi:MAG: hypothetical protein LBH64_03585, partial [Coriobacteriales bacterium]|nr:hypothetical protein [Coriobacteriales bacterium]